MERERRFWACFLDVVSSVVTAGGSSFNRPKRERRQRHRGGFDLDHERLVGDRKVVMARMLERHGLDQKSSREKIAT